MYVTDKEAYDKIKAMGVALSNGQTWRGACPLCGHTNTFTMTNMNGNLVWNCYSAGCHKSGAAQLEITAAQIKETFTHRGKEQSTEIVPYKVDARFQEPYRSTACNQFLHTWNIHSLSMDGRLVVKYDPISLRCVFLVYHNSVCVDAVGRFLVNHASAVPEQDKYIKKWYRYGNSKYGLLIGHKRNAKASQGINHTSVLVLVEDAISAAQCVYKSGVDSLALMGTHMTEEHITQMEPYKHIIIALDPDAQVAAQTFYKRLSVIKQCSILRTKDDLKYAKEEDIEKLKTSTTVH